MFETRPKVADRLDEEVVAWLTTVRPDGQPQSSIVWFLRDGDDLLIYSQENAGKLRNIAANPKVAFNLRSDEHGDFDFEAEAETGTGTYTQASTEFASLPAIRLTVSATVN